MRPEQEITFLLDVTVGKLFNTLKLLIINGMINNNNYLIWSMWRSSVKAGLARTAWMLALFLTFPTSIWEVIEAVSDAQFRESFCMLHVTYSTLF